MKILKILSSAGICAAVLAGLGASARADIIPVVDPHFDQFPTTSSILPYNGQTVGTTAATYLYFSCGGTCRFADDNIVGWKSSGIYAPGVISGQWFVGNQTNVFNSAPEPYVVRDINATISQTVSTTAVPGVTYTLDVDLGFALAGNLDLGAASLMVGDNLSSPAVPLPSDGKTRAQMEGSGNWYDFQTSYTATAADAGDPIEILLSSLTGNATPTAWFADVRLTDSLSSVNPLATPEPRTWVMMLLGFGGMAGVAAVRRSLQGRSAAVELA